MAYSAEQWERAKAYYEAGQHNPQQISDLVGIERSTIVKKAKIHNWKSGSNADYIEARVIVAEKKSQLNSQTLNVLDNIADEKIRYRDLCFGVTESALKQLKEISDIGVKEVLVTSKIGGDTIIEKETINLTPQDYESIINAADKASITLKVNDRHAKSGDVNVNATAAVQNNNQTRSLNDFYTDVDAT